MGILTDFVWSLMGICTTVHDVGCIFLNFWHCKKTDTFNLRVLPSGWISIKHHWDFWHNIIGNVKNPSPFPTSPPPKGQILTDSLHYDYRHYKYHSPSFQFYTVSLGYCTSNNVHPLYSMELILTHSNHSLLYFNINIFATQFHSLCW